MKGKTAGIGVCLKKAKAAQKSPGKKAVKGAKKSVVLDSACFINSGALDLGLPKSAEAFSTPSVLMELKDDLSRMKADIVLRQNSVALRQASEAFFAKALEGARKTGDVAKLSGTDLQLLALCIQLREEGLHPELYTDDYSLQNAANSLKVKWKGVSAKGIREQRKIVLKCTMCGYESDHALKECPKCSAYMLVREKRPLQHGKRKQGPRKKR